MKKIFGRFKKKKSKKASKKEDPALVSPSKISRRNSIFAPNLKVHKNKIVEADKHQKRTTESDFSATLKEKNYEKIAKMLTTNEKLLQVLFDCAEEEEIIYIAHHLLKIAQHIGSTSNMLNIICSIEFKSYIKNEEEKKEHIEEDTQTKNTSPITFDEQGIPVAPEMKMPTNEEGTTTAYNTPNTNENDNVTFQNKLKPLVVQTEARPEKQSYSAAPTPDGEMIHNDQNRIQDDEIELVLNLEEPQVDLVAPTPPCTPVVQMKGDLPLPFTKKNVFVSKIFEYITMEEECREYTRSVFMSIIHKVISNKTLSLELDSRIVQNAAQRRENMEKLRVLVDEMMEALFAQDTTIYMPFPIRYTAFLIETLTEVYFDKIPNPGKIKLDFMKRRILGSFFVRYILVPQLENPKQSEIVADNLSFAQKRSFEVLMQVLQQFANLEPFHADLPLAMAVNEKIQEHLPEFIKFVEGYSADDRIVDITLGGEFAIMEKVMKDQAIVNADFRDYGKFHDSLDQGFKTKNATMVAIDQMINYIAKYDQAFSQKFFCTEETLVQAVFVEGSMPTPDKLFARFIVRKSDQPKQLNLDDKAVQQEDEQPTEKEQPIEKEQVATQASHKEPVQENQEESQHDNVKEASQNVKEGAQHKNVKEDSGFIHVPPSIMHEIDNPVEAINRLKDELKEANDNLEKVTNELKEANNNLEKVTNERDTLNEANKSIEQEKATMFNSLNNEQQQHASTKKQLEQVHQTLLDKQNDIQQAQEKIGQLLVENEQLKKKETNDFTPKTNNDHENMAWVVQREKQLEQDLKALEEAQKNLASREAALAKKMPSMTVVIGGVEYQAQLQVSSPENTITPILSKKDVQEEDKVNETPKKEEEAPRQERMPPSSKTPTNAILPNSRVIAESPLTKGSPKASTSPEEEQGNDASPNIVQASPVVESTRPPQHIEVGRMQNRNLAPETPDMTTPDITSLVPMTPPMAIPSSPIGEDPQVARKRKRRRKLEVARKALTKILGIEDPSELQKIVRAGGVSKIAKIASIYATRSTELMDTLLRVLDRFANDTYCSVEVSKNDILVNLVAQTVTNGTLQQQHLASSIKERLVI